MQSVQQRRDVILRQRKEREDMANFFEVQEGNNFVRILPPWSAAGEWRKQAAYHYGIREKGTVVCLQKVYNQPCPVCAEVEQLYKMKDDEARNLAKDMRAKDRFFCNVLDASKSDGKVMILAFGPKLEEDLTTMMFGGTGPDGTSSFGCGDVTDIQSGRILQITKKTNPKDKKLTDYGVTPDSVARPLANADAICAKLHDLDVLVNKDTFTFEQIVGMMNKTAPAPAPAAAAPHAPAPGGFGALPAQQNQQPTPSPSTFGAPPPAAPPRMTSEFVAPGGFGAAPAQPQAQAAPAPFTPPPAAQTQPFNAEAAGVAPAQPSNALERLKQMQRQQNQQPPAAK
jgi:hypothetical protein